jgi:hypothetical protein
MELGGFDCSLADMLFARAWPAPRPYGPPNSAAAGFFPCFFWRRLPNLSRRYIDDELGELGGITKALAFH